MAGPLAADSFNNPEATALPVYRGRFAPSPSGPLHAGSLVAAVGSFLDARAHGGTWLVRMEDIDPPREPEGAAETILRQLEAHHLHWDESVVWQSQQSLAYQQFLANLHNKSLTYYCDCTRKQIKSRANRYDGFCRNRNVSSETSAIRFRNDNPVKLLHDRIKGSVKPDHDFVCEDFTLVRRDGLWAYQLAVVHDDFHSGITHIVRGEDLLEASAWQLTLWKTMNTLGSYDPQPLPDICHLPLVLGPDGRKLSKQNHAPELNLSQTRLNLVHALHALGLSPEPELTNCHERDILAWGIANWKI